MNFKEAMKNKNITHIRQPQWNESSCLEMPPWVEKNNSRGAWAYLIDCGNRIPIGVFELYSDSYDQYEVCEAKPYKKNVNREDL